MTFSICTHAKRILDTLFVQLHSIILTQMELKTAEMLVIRSFTKRLLKYIEKRQQFID